MRFDSFVTSSDNRQAYAAAVRLGAAGAPERLPGLVLWGPTGTGKTHLACALLNRYLDHGTFGLFLPTTQIPRGDDDAIARLADRREVPVLVVDDLGSEKMTERAAECLHKIIGGRHWNMATTVYTTNYSQENLRKVLERGAAGAGDRLVGRLFESCDWVRVGGPDRRAPEGGFTVKHPEGDD